MSNQEGWDKPLKLFALRPGFLQSLSKHVVLGSGIADIRRQLIARIHLRLRCLVGRCYARTVADGMRHFDVLENQLRLRQFRLQFIKTLREFT